MANELEFLLKLNTDQFTKNAQLASNGFGIMEKAVKTFNDVASRSSAASDFSAIEKSMKMLTDQAQRSAASQISASQRIAQALQYEKATQDAIAISIGKAHKEASDQTWAEKAKGSWDKYALAINQTLGIIQTAISLAKSAVEKFEELAIKQTKKDAIIEGLNALGVSHQKLEAEVGKATNGTVKSLTALSGSYSLVKRGVTSDVEEIAAVWRLAKKVAYEEGRDTEEVFNQISQAITMGMGRSLITMGILPEKFGRASDSAKLLENRASLLNLVLQESARISGTVGTKGDTARDSTERLAKSIAALESEGSKFWKEIAPPIVDALAQIAKWAAIAAKNMNLVMSAKRSDFDKQAKAALEDAGYGDGDGLPTGNKPLVPDKFHQEIQAEIEKRKKAAAALKKQKEKEKKDQETFADSLFSGVTDEEIKWEEKQYKEAEQLRKEGASSAKKAADEYAKSVEEMRKEEEKLDATISSSAFWIGIDQYFSQMQDLGKGLEAVTSSTAMFTDGFVKASAAVAGGMPNLVSLGLLMAKKVDSANGMFSPEFWKTVASTMGKVTEGLNYVSDLATARPEVYEALNKKSEEEKKALEEFKNKFSINVKEAFEQGINDAEDFEDFFSKFGTNLAKQLKRALAAGITQSIFGTSSGSFNIMGAIMGGGRSSAPSSDDLLANTTASYSGGGGQYTGASSAAGGGLLSKIMAPMRHTTGGINWAGVGTNIAIAAAAQFLTSPGRLFGGTKVHGQEAVGQAADINAQVADAIKQRDQILQTSIGLSKQTADALKGIQFYTAGYNKNNSGDGWFGGPKTTTYELNATKANEALAAFAEATKKAEYEVAQRSYDVAIVAMDRPFTALEIQLSDLREAINRSTVGTKERLDLELQAAQMERTKLEFWRGERQAWAQFFISGITGAPNETKRHLEFSFKTDMQNPDDPFNSGTGIRARIGAVDGAGAGTVASWLPVSADLSPQQIAWLEGIRGGGISKTGKYKVGNKEMTSEEFQSWAGTLIQMTGISDSSKAQVDLNKQLSSGAKIWDTEIGGMNYMELMKKRIFNYSEALSALENRIADENTSAADREALYADWQAANSAYWTAKSNLLDLEKQKADEAAEKQKEVADKLKESESQWRSFSEQYAAFLDTSILMSLPKSFHVSTVPGVPEIWNAPMASTPSLQGNRAPMWAMGSEALPKSVSAPGGAYITPETRGLAPNYASLPYSISNLGVTNTADDSGLRPAYGTMGSSDPATAQIFAMMRAVSESGKYSFGIASAQAEGKKNWEIPEYIDNLAKRISSYQEMMDAAEKKANDAALTLEERQSWVREYITYSQDYWNARIESANMEAEKAAELKAKRETRTDDILSALTMAIGETYEANGKTVMVIAGQNPEFDSYLAELREGMDPAARAVFDKLAVTKKAKTRWRS